ncbi:MAG TPA: glycosyltransferase family 2 protein, partial [Bacteroidota bacterium]
IATANRAGQLADTLASLARIRTVGDTELIVVDNNSKDGTAEMIRSDFPDAVLIENEVNRGVAPSRNQALRRAKGRYALILDADMLLVENSLRQMVDFMDRTADAGICACALISPEGFIQPSARRYPSPFVFVLRRLVSFDAARRSAALRRHEMADWDRTSVLDVDYVIGACQMIRREALDQVGLLDEKIFYGPEDIDYCLRMYRNGWKVYFYPHTRIIHIEQRITKKKLFSRMSFLHLRGIIYLFIKYGGKLSR